MMKKKILAVVAAAAMLLSVAAPDIEADAAVDRTGAVGTTYYVSTLR